MSSSHFPNSIELLGSIFFLTLDLPPKLFHLLSSLHFLLLLSIQWHHHHRWHWQISSNTFIFSTFFSYSWFGDTTNIADANSPTANPDDTAANADISLLHILMISSMLPSPTLQLLEIWVTLSTPPVLTMF